MASGTQRVGQQPSVGPAGSPSRSAGSGSQSCTPSSAVLVFSPSCPAAPRSRSEAEGGEDQQLPCTSSAGPGPAAAPGSDLQQRRARTYSSTGLKPAVAPGSDLQQRRAWTCSSAGLGPAAAPGSDLQQHRARTCSSAGLGPAAAPGSDLHFLLPYIYVYLQCCDVKRATRVSSSPVLLAGSPWWL